jgi:hypothetical protein
MPPLAWGFAPMRRSPLGASSAKFRFQAALLIEEFLGPVAAQPVFQQLEMLGMRGRIGERHLMRTEGAFDLQAIDDLRPRPALGRIEHDHRPARTLRLPWTRASCWIF